MKGLLLTVSLFCFGEKYKMNKLTIIFVIIYGRERILKKENS